jgi:hypothetical protein
MGQFHNAICYTAASADAFLHVAWACVELGYPATSTGAQHAVHGCTAFESIDEAIYLHWHVGTMVQCTSTDALAYNINCCHDTTVQKPSTH